eukprot:6949091-Prorocentrum_lima.AAC.1
MPKQCIGMMKRFAKSVKPRSPQPTKWSIHLDWLHACQAIRQHCGIRMVKVLNYLWNPREEDNFST